MKVSLGPVTRIEGHLNVTTTIEGNVVTDARCSGEMFRGFETILRGRHPLDAQQITQRICGVCPYAHGIASSYAQENAYKLEVPPNGRILQNLIQGANHLYDYLFHFYQLCILDFVDVTAIAEYKGSDKDLGDLREWIKAELASGRKFPAAPFLPRLCCEYIKDPEVNISVLKNYLEAMKVQQKANQASAIFGGRFPHATAIFPGGCSRRATIDLIVSYQSLISEVLDFCRKKYIPDILAVAESFPEYWNIGVSRGGMLSYGLLPLGPEADAPRLLESGVLFDGRVEAVDFENITEDVKYSRYSSASGRKITNGALQPDPGKSSAYSWIKAPRYREKMVEVGPAARIMIDYFRNNNPRVRDLVDSFTAKAGMEVSRLNSVMGRHLCRAISAVVLGESLLEQCDGIDYGAPTMADYEIPESGEGFGVTEASRGGLLHYIRIRNHRIDKYECVVPTTWNCSPRDDRGNPGALESALIGTEISKPEEQIESVRIVHSFDPCLACAVH